MLSNSNVVQRLSLLLAVSFGVAQQRSTWEVIQEEVWTPRCVECHQEGTTFGEQSDLYLTSDVAYEELVNTLPNNTAARGDGFLLLGNDGLASLPTSFLWEKINASDKEHFYSDHPYYGAQMPLGASYLTNGQLAFIKEWILGGAPKEGIVEKAKESLLDDTTRYDPPEFMAIDTPEQGIQLHLGPFEISPQFEREFYYFQPLDTTGNIYIERAELTMRSGSHHFIAYSFSESIPAWVGLTPFEYRDIRAEDGSYIQSSLLATLWHSFGFGAQIPFMNYQFPNGVALRLDADLGLDLNSHYINLTDTASVGEVYINMHLLKPEEVDQIAEVLSLNHLTLSLPPNKVTTLDTTFTFIEDASVFQLMSHAHEHMLEFRVEKVGGELDGELVYIAYDWDHPPILELDPPIHVRAGEGLKLIVTYDNWTDETLRFGFLSEDEMMILFGYYYFGSPKASIEEEPLLPVAFDLRQNYPNPFNAETKVEFTLNRNSNMKLYLYDMIGRPVTTLLDGDMAAGTHTVNWSASDNKGRPLPSGVYLIKLSVQDQFRVIKAVLLR